MTIHPVFWILYIYLYAISARIIPKSLKINAFTF